MLLLSRGFEEDTEYENNTKIMLFTFVKAEDLINVFNYFVTVSKIDGRRKEYDERKEGSSFESDLGHFFS